jgi:hypothetical protein
LRVECLGEGIPGSAVPFEFNDNHVAPPVEAEQIHEAVEVGCHLPADDEDLVIIQESIRIGLQPLLQHHLLVLQVERAIYDLLFAATLLRRSNL